MEKPVVGERWFVRFGSDPHEAEVIAVFGDKYIVEFYEYGRKIRDASDMLSKMPDGMPSTNDFTTTGQLLFLVFVAIFWTRVFIQWTACVFEMTGAT